MGQHELGRHESLQRCAVVKSERGVVVNGDAITAVIAKPEVVLGLGAALFCSGLKQRDRPFLVAVELQQRELNRGFDFDLCAMRMAVAENRKNKHAMNQKERATCLRGHWSRAVERWTRLKKPTCTRPFLKKQIFVTQPCSGQSMAHLVVL